MKAQRFRRLFFFTSCLLFLTGIQAQAAFIYSVSPNPASITFGGSTATFTGGSSSLPLTTITLGVIFRIADSSTTAPPATDAGSFSIQEAVSITNIPPSGFSDTGIIDVTGTLQFLRSDSGGEVSFFTPSAPTFSATIGGVVYTLSNFSYTGPTVNNGLSTATSALFSSSPAPVPEPASLTAMALGLAGVGLLRRHLWGK